VSRINFVVDLVLALAAAVVVSIIARGLGPVESVLWGLVAFILVRRLHRPKGGQ